MKPKYFLVCFAFLTVLSILGCIEHPDFDAKLPNGYELSRTNAFSTHIWSPSEADGFSTCVVPSNIRGMGIKDDYVFGWLEYNPDSDPLSVEVIPGYFLLNTANAEVTLGLEEDAWVKKMKGVGIDKPLSLLKKPRKFRHFKPPKR